MIFYFLLLLLVAFVGAKMAPANEFMQDYMAPRNTRAVNGFFVAYVILRHSTQFVTFDGPYDQAFMGIYGFFGQMMGATFLFYSGFGIMESIQRKGYAYVHDMPRRHFLGLLVRLDIVTLIYLVICTLIGMTFPLRQILLAFTGFENFGNSTWYIFVMLVMYLIIFIAFQPYRRNERRCLYLSAVLLTLGAMLFILFFRKMGKEPYWYNTLIIFVAGVWYSLLRKPFERFVMRSTRNYLLTWTLLLLIFVAAQPFKGNWKLMEFCMLTLWEIALMLMFVLFTMKITIRNSLLEWLGEHIFSIYMLQYIPLGLMKWMGYTGSETRYLFVAVTFITSCLMAAVFQPCTQKLVDRLFPRIEDRRS